MPAATWCSPGAMGGPKNRNRLGEQISLTILKETGLKMHPHLFRHLGAFLYLEQEPGGYEVVRRMLGHKSINTTVSNYVGFEAPAAVRHFDDTILARRTPRIEADSQKEPRK
jgi:integrase